MLFAIFLIAVAGLAATGVITEGDKEAAAPSASAQVRSGPSAPINR
jgi:hypothetical protein